MSDSSHFESAPRLRRLLPALSRPPAQIKKARQARQPSRLSPALAACASCRKQKVKRPKCLRCIQRHLDCCYTTKPGETEAQARTRVHIDVRNRATTSEQLLELLTTLPESEAQDILQRIRGGTDISTLLNQVRDGDLLLQLAIVPETRFRYELPYRSAMPQELLANNPYLDSKIYEHAILYPGDWSRINVSQRSVADGVQKQHLDPYLRPFHAADVAEPMLADLQISAWTLVCDDNLLMRDIIKWWVRCEYQFTAAFQKDLFLEDMSSGREDFCSPLLVNIVLGYACVSYPRFSDRAKYWNPNTLMYRFIAEARRLWELEDGEPRITTMQAGILFSVFYNLCGLDEIGHAYRLQSVTLANAARIFDHESETENKRIRHGKEFTSWALFNWETLVGFSFMFPPLLKEPPVWPLPDPSRNSGWYGDIWVKYPLNDHQFPSHFGQVFRARCEFRVIMNEACHKAWSEGSEITLEHAKHLHASLKDWFSRLPDPLRPRALVLPGHLQLHMYYHHLIITIFELVSTMESSLDSSPQQVIAEAHRNLQTLIRLYYIRHGFEAMDLFIVIPLMLLASECIDNIDENASTTALEFCRATLILTTKGLISQRKNHYLANALFRVIRGQMRPEEIALFRDVMQLTEDDLNNRPGMAQAVRSHWPVRVVKQQQEKDAHFLTNLVQNFAHLNVAPG